MKYYYQLSCQLSQAFVLIAAVSASLLSGAIAAPALAQVEAPSAANPSELAAEGSVEVIDFTLVVGQRQSFEDLMQEAASLANRLVEQGFANPQAEVVVVNILGDRSGQILPLMSVRVPRAEWRSAAQIDRWMTYAMGRPAMQLLGFLQRDPVSSMSAAGVVSSSVTAPRSVSSPINQSPTSFVPVATPGSTEDYGLQEESLEQSDPGYR